MIGTTVDIFKALNDEELAYYNAYVDMYGQEEANEQFPNTDAFRKFYEGTIGEPIANVGKYSQSIYGEEATTINGLAELEHKKSLENAKEITDAYGRDIASSFEQAKDRAYDNSFSKFNKSTLTERDAFINKVRDVGYSAFESDATEYKASAGYSDAIDIPITVAGAIGYDLGSSFGKGVSVAGKYTTDTLSSGVQRFDKFASKGLDNVTKFSDGLSRDIDGIGDNLSKKMSLLYAQAPWMKTSKKLTGAEKELTFEDSFFKVLNGGSAWLRNLVGEFGDVLNEWYHDPRTLCCLIKNLAALAASYGDDNFKDQQDKLFHGGFDVEKDFKELDKVRVFFDKMIAILKLIREFLKKDLSLDLMMNLDLGLAMSKASLGGAVAFMMALQQMLEDQVFYKMMEWVENNTREEWRVCFPFEKLIRLLADYVTGPDGLFKRIQEYVDSFLTGFSNGSNYGFDKKKKFKLKDLAALDKLISILESIRDATLNLELCLEANIVDGPDLKIDPNDSEKRVDITRDYDSLTKDVRQSDLSDDDISNRVVFPTDTEVKSFIMNRMGESEDFANQVLMTANQSSDISGRGTGSPDDAGTELGDGSDNSFGDQLIKSIGDCSKTLDPDRINKLAELMANWN